ncbi:MAG: 4Fe-4S binding protein, partial [Acetobacterium sp.]|nr:4Fe-4S binding protein [Bacillota bacterium]MCG2731086.1 4Fe-4S binding protein [Acetobacterium sp.]
MENKIRKQWKKASPDEIGNYVESIHQAVNRTRCPVDQLKQFTDTVRRNSCGECVICREGLLQLAVVTAGITQGLGREQDVEIIQDISDDLIIGSSCDYGKEVGKIIRQQIAEYEDDFTKHIKRKRCDGLVCNKLVSFYVSPETCTGCGKCLDVCPVNAVAGGEGLIHVIDVSRCNHCGDCEAVCSDKAILRAGAVLPKLPQEPVPVGSFQADAESGGLMSRKRR